MNPCIPECRAISNEYLGREIYVKAYISVHESSIADTQIRDRYNRFQNLTGPYGFLKQIFYTNININILLKIHELFSGTLYYPHVRRSYAPHKD